MNRPAIWPFVLGGLALAAAVALAAWWTVRPAIETPSNLGAPVITLAEEPPKSAEPNDANFYRIQFGWIKGGSREDFVRSGDL